MIGYETTYPNELEFKCDVGFELQGSATRKCEADRQWSGEEVTCKGKFKKYNTMYHDLHFGVIKCMLKTKVEPQGKRLVSLKALDILWHHFYGFKEYRQ